ncbi:class I SAM-dependent methyltransferase [Gemmatimonadota bacterium]
MKRMDRQPISHGGVFDDEAFAHEYARKHWKMAVRVGEAYAKKLKKSGFRQGRVLDVGCGFGATNLTLAERFPDSEFVGIDLSEPLLAMAREAAHERDLAGRARFEKADVMEIPFEDDSFDGLVNLNMVHLVDDPARMLDEMERVLAPDGFLFLADLKRSFLGMFEREIRSALSSWEARELLEGSPLRRGEFLAGLLWWRYECLP